MALNAKTEKRWWLWTPNWKVMKALNAKTENNDGSERQSRECDSEHQTRKWWWLWTPRPKMWWGWPWTPILRSDNDDSERRTKMWCWLWMSKLKSDDDDYERRTGNTVMALNAKTEKRWWLWTPNWKAIMALNAKLKIVMALNAKTEKRQWLWMPKLKSDDDSERQTKQNMAPNVGMNDVIALNAEWEYDSECQTEE